VPYVVRNLPFHSTRTSVTVNGHDVPVKADLLEANVWVYPNVPGKSHADAGGAPFCLELDAGVAVYPRAMATAPRLPLLGMRALRLAGLRLSIDCQALSVSIQTKRRLWIF
jgi:hypothetical protein